MHLLAEPTGLQESKSSEETPESGFQGAEHVSQTAVHAQLEKVLTSPTLVRSKRLGRFLRFTVEQFLQGKQGALKEYLVGVEVFNKLETFDPRIDSIVRVEARRLRSKLERYYELEGKDDPIVLQFRKGSYVPMVLTREQLRAMTARTGPDRNGVRSIAINRLSTFTAEPVHTHFSVGLVEDIISALTNVAGIEVVARHPALSNGLQAPADYLLEGSVRESGDQCRISAQLIDARKNTYIWSETFQRNLSDLFAVQDEIASAIVHAIRLQIEVPHQDFLTSRS